GVQPRGDRARAHALGVPREDPTHRVSLCRVDLHPARTGQRLRDVAVCTPAGAVTCARLALEASARTAADLPPVSLARGAEHSAEDPCALLARVEVMRDHLNAQVRELSESRSLLRQVTP